MSGPQPKGFEKLWSQESDIVKNGNSAFVVSLKDALGVLDCKQWKPTLADLSREWTYLHGRFWDSSQDPLEGSERSRIQGVLEALSSRNDLKGCFGGEPVDQPSFKIFFHYVSCHSRFTFPREIPMGLIWHLVTWDGQRLSPG